MKKRYFVILACILAFSCTSVGCKKISRELLQKIEPEKNKAPVVERVNDVKLAEAIMWPEPYSFNLARDPFKPIVKQEAAIDEEKQTKPISIIEDLQLTGTGVSENVCFALIKSSSTTKIYKLNDTISDYTVTQIEPKRVVLKKENDEIVLKLGGDRKNE